MSGKQAKAMRRNLRRMYEKDVTDFKTAAEGLPLWERVKLAWRIIWRCV